ncbi:MAG TPA: hypothetical protein VHW00_10120 [Thermoanaerobaculia bacterium]|nr:hypothetical protein [Thermoanaerobaculia bacterium]
MRKLLLLSLFLLTTSPAWAAEVLIPAVFRGNGAFDSLWRTEIVVSNLTLDPLLDPTPVTITFHGDNGFVKEISMPLSRMEVIAVPDAVRDWFDVENGGGIVRVTWSNANARIVARARIYNVSAQGQYGQSVPGIDVSRLASDHYMPGVSGVDGNRTNIGVSNPTNQDTIAWIELIDTAGNSRGSFAVGIPARSYKQYNDIFSYFNAGPLSAAMVRVSSQNTILYAYASIVRNDTGDATFVPGQ